MKTVRGLTKEQVRRLIWTRQVMVNNRKIELEHIQSYGGFTGNAMWELLNAQELLREAEAMLERF